MSPHCQMYPGAGIREQNHPWLITTELTSWCSGVCLQGAVVWLSSLLCCSESPSRLPVTVEPAPMAGGRGQHSPSGVSSHAAAGILTPRAAQSCHSLATNFHSSHACKAHSGLAQFCLLPESQPCRAACSPVVGCILRCIPRPFSSPKHSSPPINPTPPALASAIPH